MKVIVVCRACDIAVCPKCHYSNQSEAYNDNKAFLCIDHDPENGFDEFIEIKGHKEN